MIKLGISDLARTCRAVPAAGEISTEYFPLSDSLDVLASTSAPTVNS